jgi:formyl-CoA transferase
MRLVDVPKVTPRLAPDLGQHSIEVLQELAFSAAEIAELKSSGAVVAKS